MLLSKLKTLYEWIDKANTNVKTLIIVVLAVLLFDLYYSAHTKAILEDYTEITSHNKKMAEDYTEMITPVINGHVDQIIKADKEASNVLLLNYHNTLLSTNGLSYRYLTALTEKRKGYDTRSYIRMWKELEYVNYGDELERINNEHFIRMDSIPAYYRAFPNLVALLVESHSKSAALYPIIGVDGPIGMLVVLYPERKHYYLGYYNAVIAPNIQPMSTLLDYNSVKEKFKKIYGNKQEEPSSMLQRFNAYLLE